MLATITVAADNPIGPTNCIPFGSGSYPWTPYSGFVYRNVPAFTAQPGDTIAFDMGQVNEADIQFDIALAATTTNGSNVNAGPFVQVVSNNQTAATPRGDTIRGNYELAYTFETGFSFAGGGLIIRVSNPSPGFLADGTCTQMLFGGTSGDSSGNFVQRFFRDIDGVSPWDVGDGGAIANFRIVTSDINTPPVLSDVALSNTSIVEGDSTSLTGVITDPQGGPYMLTVNWGDGVQETIQLPANTTTFSVPHTYADDNPTDTTSDVYEVEIVSLTDPQGGEAVGGTGQIQRTMTFDNRIPGPVTSYDEEGMRLRVLEPNDHIDFGNFGGDSSGDVLAHTGSASPLRFELVNGGTFTLVSFDVVRFDGPAVFTSSTGASVTANGLGTIVLPNVGWTNITHVDWTSISAGLAIDNLVFRTNTSPGSTVNLVANGDFESSLAGWSVVNSGNGNWIINDGGVDPPGPGLPLSPISGNFDAMSVQGGAGLHLLSSPILIPTNVSSATLNWSDRIRNYSGQGFVDPNQEFRVEIVGQTGAVLHTVFSTNPGDATQQLGPNSRSFDLTSVLQSLQGQTVFLRFAEQDNLGFFNVNLDDVSLMVGTGSPIAPLEVTVFNAAPNASLTGPTAVTEGTAVTFTGSFTDVGLDDGHSQSWSVTASNGQVIPGQVFNPTASGDSDGAGGSTFSFTPVDDGVYTVTYSVTDDDGGTSTQTATLIVSNVAPEATVTGPASVVEGTAVTFNGSFTDVGSDDGHSQSWSVSASNGQVIPGQVFNPTASGDSDGAGGSTFSFTPVDDGVYTVTYSVTDDDGDTSTQTATLVVSNAEPVITGLTTDSAICGGASENEAVQLDLTFDDPGTGDTHQVVVDWGDGTTEVVDLTAGERAVALSHNYSVGGVYEISVSVTDDDGDSDSASTSAVISGVGVVGNTLYVIGTEQADHVTINQTGNGTIKVHADFLESGTPRNIPAIGVEQIVVILCAGDDHATISNNVSIPALLDGGEGNDQLNAGGGGAVLLGGSGNDILLGGSGRDILIGGLGNDQLVGNSGADVLIGGSSDYESDCESGQLADLAILAFIDEEQAVDDLLASLTDDEVEDVLNGASGDDLIVAGLGDTLLGNESGGGNTTGNGKAKGKNK